MCRNPTLKECEDDTHTPEMGTWESSKTPENSKFDCKGQNTLPWNVFYTVGNVLKCRCRKWPRMSRSDICSTSYARKKGRESIWLPTTKIRETRSWCVQVECDTPLESSQEELQVCLNLIPIGGLNKELWTPKVLGFQTRTVSGLLLGSPEKKCHSDVGAAGKRREYYMRKGGGFPRVRAVVSHVNWGSPMACLSTERAPKCELTNLLVGLMQVRVTK
jgi:hypothetical protein